MLEARRIFRKPRLASASWTLLAGLVFGLVFGLGFGLGCQGPSESSPAASARLPTHSRVTPGSASADGESLFRMHCATCHLGGGGLLGSPRTPDLFEVPLPRGTSEDAILQSIRYGIDPPRMPAFRSGLDEAEIHAITDYVLERRRAVQGQE
jgi:mono/diheme cytochrome c family protein